jgi:sortase A
MGASPDPPTDDESSPNEGPAHSRWWRRAGIVVAITAIAGGLAIGGSIAWFYYHSHTVGHALVNQEQRAIRAASGGAVPSPANCPAFDGSSAAPQGLLEAPSIGLQAPVLAGDGNDQLDVAVGHVPASAWPGQPGTTILAAHDVTYFSAIDHLWTGERVAFATPCRTYVFVVTGHQIVTSGSPVYSSPNQSLLVLETCYPLNALFITSQRYLVTAEFQGTEANGAPVGAVANLTPAPTVPAPPALTAQGLTLATNYVQLGTLDIVGTPLPSWQQGPNPLNDEGAVLSEYLGALHAAEQGRADWWGALAPSVPFTSASVLNGATISGYVVPLDPMLAVKGSQLMAAEVTTTVRVSGGAAPGIYKLVANMADPFGSLVITGWSLTPSS